MDSTEQLTEEIKKTSFYYDSYDSITKIHAVCFEPVDYKSGAKGIIQIVHGMSEYIDRYDDFASYLCKRGFIVVGNDHLGHGESICSKGDYGYFAKVQGDKTVIRDFAKLQRIIKKKYPGLPYIILGHSMGSFLTRRFLCIKGKSVDGAIICATGHVELSKINIGLSTTRILARLFGWKYRSRFVEFNAFAGYNKKVEKRESCYDWISSDAENRQKYLADERCGFRFTLNGYYNFFKTMKVLHRKDMLERMPKNLPIFFIAGSMDPVGGYGKGVEKVVEQFKKIGMENVEFKLYEGARHEIINDFVKDEVYDDVAEWSEIVISRWRQQDDKQCN